MVSSGCYWKHSLSKKEWTPKQRDGFQIPTLVFWCNISKTTKLG